MSYLSRELQAKAEARDVSGEEGEVRSSYLPGEASADGPNLGVTFDAAANQKGTSACTFSNIYNPRSVY